MHALQKICIFLVLSIVISTVTYAQPDFSNGKIFKFAIPKSGVYKINYDFLKEIGASPSKINPRNIRMYAGRGGMLPQANSSVEGYETKEIAIHLVGENDHQFDRDDFVLFYAEGPDEITYDIPEERIFLVKNLYDTANYVFLKLGQNVGKRISTTPAQPIDDDFIETCDDVIHHELEKKNLLFSGRYWVGEKLSIENEETERRK